MHQEQLEEQLQAHQQLEEQEEQLQEHQTVLRSRLHCLRGRGEEWKEWAAESRGRSRGPHLLPTPLPHLSNCQHIQ